MPKTSILGRRETKPISEPPVDWAGSAPEYYVYQALFRLGYKGRFQYQSPLWGGRAVKGGVVIDFYISQDFAKDLDEHLKSLGKDDGPNKKYILIVKQVLNQMVSEYIN